MGIKGSNKIIGALEVQQVCNALRHSVMHSFIEVLYMHDIMCCMMHKRLPLL